jgi:hypothetical protein
MVTRLREGSTHVPYDGPAQKQVQRPKEETWLGTRE